MTSRTADRLRKPVILTFVRYYLPGYRSGGPIRSVANLVERLGDEFCFRIVTRDRDAGDESPYPNIARGNWNQIGKAQVLYLPPSHEKILSMRRLLVSTKYDLLYLNSFFAPQFSIQPAVLRWLQFSNRAPVVLAPRGEFSDAALALKSTKKRFYLFWAKLSRIYNDVLWQASSPFEVADIKRVVGNVPTVVAPNLLASPDRIDDRPDINEQRRKEKRPGELDIVVIGRINVNKNILQALEILKGVEGRIEFHIYGPLNDSDYWEKCQATARSLPGNISVAYHGPIRNEIVHAKLRKNHLFFLPTLGENYGHAIIEALAAGCPVVISDRTPWRGLRAAKAGQDIALDQPDRFREAIAEFVRMGENEYKSWSNGALNYARELHVAEDALAANRAMFETALGCV